MNEKSMICLSDFIKKGRDGAAVLITDSTAVLSCHWYVRSEPFLITAVVKWATFTVIVWLWNEYYSVRGGIASHLVICYALTAVISAVIVLACLMINKLIILGITVSQWWSVTKYNYFVTVLKYIFQVSVLYWSSFILSNFYFYFTTFQSIRSYFLLHYIL